MNIFPDNLALIEFFEAEPLLSDPDVPWAYNRLEFAAKLGDDRVECVIDNPQLEVRWFRNGVEQAYLQFSWVHSLSIQEYPGGKSLVAEGVGHNGNSTFRLQLRPRVHLSVSLTK